MNYFRFDDTGAFLGTFTGNVPTSGFDGQQFVPLTEQHEAAWKAGSTLTYENGNVVVTPMASVVAATVARSKRDALLARTDWTQLPDVPETTRSAYVAYRAALRDVPTQTGFPLNVEWPDLPASE